jgi:Flp pilus assembly protein TadB
LRAVADDHQAAQSIGIPLNRIWVIVWCVAGIVALVAGMIWGSRLGVQFSLSTVALRALPVVILRRLNVCAWRHHWRSRSLVWARSCLKFYLGPLCGRRH